MTKTYPPYQDMNIDTTLDSENNNWDNWSPSWTNENKTPHDIQEKHSPTKKVKITKSLEVNRRLVDIKLWDALTNKQKHAALEIYKSFETLTRGVGYSSMKFERQIKSTVPNNISETQAEIISFYMDWATNCVKNNISHSIIIDIICYGFSCSKSDKFRKIRKGKSKEQLLNGLNLYSKMKSKKYI